MVKCNMLKNYTISVIHITALTILSSCFISDGKIEVTLPSPATSSELICPDNYVKVPGNGSLNVDEFCVMKYEAKAWQDDNSDSIITNDELDETVWSFTGSHPNLTYSADNKHTGTHLPVSAFDKKPWTINTSDAWYVCDKLNTETIRVDIDNDINSDGTYALTSNAEWMTMARDIENVAENWTSGTIGVDCLKTGNTNAYNCNGNPTGFNGPAVKNYLVPSGLTNSSNILAKFTFSNGNEVWDLAGNISEWVDLDPTDNIYTPITWISRPSDGGNYTNVELKNLDTNINITDELHFDTYSPNDIALDGSNGVGRYHGSAHDLVQPGGGLVRGGNAQQTGLQAGIFRMDVGFHIFHDTFAWFIGFPSFNAGRSPNNIGFRCVWRP
jgi:hypothetical protein